MKIVHPVSERDLSLATAQSELLLKFGHLAAHTGVLLLAPSVASKADAIQNNLKQAYGQFELVQLAGGITEVGGSQNPFQPHVVAANQMFKSIVKHFIATDNDKEWFWMEADVCPLQDRWADELQRDYLTSIAFGKPFLGSVVAGVEFTRDAEGEFVIREDPASPFMVGAGLYPARVDRYSALWKTALNTPWDALMRWEVKLAGCTNSTKIVHNHSTRNYKLVGKNELTCEILSRPSRSKTEISLPPEALLLHGCKDLSLTSIISKSLDAAKPGGAKPLEKETLGGKVKEK